MNWLYGLFGPSLSASEYRDKGVRIAFESRDVFPEDIHNQSVIVQRQHVESDAQGTHLCWCEVRGDVRPVQFTPIGDVNGTVSGVGPNQMADGALFRGEITPGLYRILVKGDYIRARHKRAADVNHLPPWFGNPPDPNYRTGDGIEGGFFESWLIIRD